MSNIYLTEPPTQGKVLIHTTAGDIDMELWAKEAPLACRNFIQLSLEGYYDNTPVNRVVKDFMVQAGDPTGTGSGGTSIWGRPFKDEIHGRIKFNHRGQVAMANENKPNTNHSQFFITLGECEWINRKHTIFGKVTGNTIFNVLKLGDVEVDASDRPIDPIMITKVEVLWNPFEDIVPRMLSAVSAGPAGEGTDKLKKKARKGAKDLKLLSFGDDEEAVADGDDVAVTKGKMISAHDVPQDKLSAEVDQELLEIARAERNKEQLQRREREGKQRDTLVAGGVGGSEQTARGAGDVNGGGETDFEARMLNQIREKRKKMGGSSRSVASTSGLTTATRGGDEQQIGSEDEEYLHAGGSSSSLTADKQAKKEFDRLKQDMLRSRRAVKVMTGHEAEQHRSDTAFQELITPLEQRRQRYIKRKREHGNREEDTLSKLKEFQDKLKKTKNTGSGIGGVGEEGPKSRFSATYSGQVTEQDESEESAWKDGNDVNWHVGKLKFRKHIDDQYRMGGDGRSLDDYKVEDEWRK